MRCVDGERLEGGADLPPPVGRGRPRSEAARIAVIDAAAALLDEGGLPAATIEAISARSGVSKPTIYRHWSNRAAVAIDAFALRMAERVPLANSGDARRDLVEQVCRVAEFYSTHAGRVLAQLLAATVTDPDAAAQLRDGFFAGRRAETSTIWNRGVAAGQLRSDITAFQAIDVLFSPIMFRLLVGHDAITREAIAPLAEAALTGLATSTATAPSARRGRT
jgi:AcrR family transcriptional regulator